MSIEETIARPYAKAIFEIAKEQNRIEKWTETLIFIKNTVSHQKLKKFLSHTVFSENLYLLLLSIQGEILNENEKNLIKLLSKNKRLVLINCILKKFVQLHHHYKNIQIVELRTVCSIKKEHFLMLQKKLEKILLKKVKFIHIIDPHILNGITLKINNTVFDFSTRNYLKQFSDFLNFKRIINAA